jgi:hypothetical protein
MKSKIILILMLTCLTAKPQQCNPYHQIHNYDLDKDKSAAIGYVSCIHAMGVVAEVGYDKMFVGVLAMGEGHDGATYGFLQYEYYNGRYRIYAGPSYRLNNQPSLMIGRAGLDVQMYKNIYGTISILQVNRELNYFHYGVKLIY